MKEEVQRKKDEVKNMTMMILNEERGMEHQNSQNILEELEQEGSGDREKMGQSMMQLRSNLSTLNQTQKLNTTVNFINRIFNVIKFKES